MPAPNPHKINNLDDLRAAVDLRRSLRPGRGRHYPSFGKRQIMPASWVYNMNAGQVHYMIQQGLFIYTPSKS